jgi:hypothetical protein
MVSPSRTRTPRRRRFDQMSSPQMSSPRRSPRQRIRRVRDDAADVVPLTERAQPSEDDSVFADADSQSGIDSDVSIQSTTQFLFVVLSSLFTVNL